MSRHRPLTSFVSALAVLLLAATSCRTDDPGAAAAGDGPRTVEVAMADVAFRPAQLHVEAGETVRLVFTNTGQVPHDAFIGDAAAQSEHGAEMERHAHGHGTDADAVTVEPGGTAALVHTFDEAGEVLIGCHQPGHYEAGMVATVTAS